MVKWTHEQQNAIRMRDTGLLVSAAAGSGKTATLIERIIDILSDESSGVMCKNVLVTTFTNAAAGEIKERIRNSISKKVRDDPQNVYLRKQYDTIADAVISTLHSFCSSVIRSNSSLINLDPYFSVMDETIADKYLDESIHRVFLNKLDEKDKSFKKLLSTFGYGRNFNALSLLIASALKTIKSYPDYEQWITEAVQNTVFESHNLFDNLYGKIIKEYLLSDIEDCIKHKDYVKDTYGQTDLYIHYEHTFVQDEVIINRLKELLIAENWDKLKECSDIAWPKNLPRKKKEFDDDSVDLIKSYRDRLKNMIKIFKEQIYDYEQEIIKDGKYMLPILTSFADTVILVDEQYSTMKNKAKVIDYADMEHMALNCLKAGANEYYKDRFKHIFIDEYQDFNYLQEEIIKSISDGSNVFSVGDLKQSIYRFRNAQTAIFRQKAELFDENPDAGTKLNLTYNFRSRHEILDYVNGIFKNIMSNELGEVDYTQSEHLQCGANIYNQPKTGNMYDPEIITIEFNRKTVPNTVLLNDDYEAEASVIADRIKKLVQNGLPVYDKQQNKMRPVTYKDIVILSRATNPYAQTYAKILEMCNIPAYSDQSVDFFKNPDISDIYALLNVIDNPYQDIYIAQVMKMSVYGFTDQDIACIKTDSRHLYDCIAAYSDEYDIKKKIDVFMNDNTDIKEYAKRNTLEKTVYYAMIKSGIYYTSDNKEILNSFYLLSVDCTAKGIIELPDFLAYLTSKNKKDIDIISAALKSGAENAVKIMSIHKSKGLEFPVVFVAGCFRRFNLSDTRKRILIDKMSGIGCEYINDTNKTYHKHFTKNAVSLSIKNQSLSEEMRILYVALTRAKEKLILCGTGNFKKTMINPNEATCFFDWVIPNTDENFIKNFDNEDLVQAYEKNIGNEIQQDLTTIQHVDMAKAMAIDMSMAFENIKKRIDFEYPYMDQIDKNRKVTVTELSKYISKNYETDDFYNSFETLHILKPSFMEKDDKKMSAAAKGTKMHRIMASVDLKKLSHEDYLSYLHTKIDDGQLYQKIIAFKDSFAYSLIENASVVHKEKVFFVPVITSENGYDIFDIPKQYDERSSLMQGVIDCLCINKNQASIIDYKTDKVKPGDEQSHALRYRSQLLIYKKAVENITGLNVKHLIIHFFETNVNVDLIGMI